MKDLAEAGSQTITTAEELIGALQRLGDKPPKQPQPDRVFALLNLREPVSLEDGVIPRIAGVITSLDATWATQLLIVQGGQRSNASVLIRRLAGHLTAEAQRKVGYPVEPIQGETRNEQLERWMGPAIERLRGEPGGFQPALWVVALLPDRKTNAFVAGVVRALEIWTKSEGARHDPDRFATVSLDIARRPGGRKLAEQVLTMMRPYRESADRFARDVAEAEGRRLEREQARERLQSLLNDARMEESRRSEELAAADAELAEVKEQLEQSRRLLGVREKEARVERAGEVARLKGMVRQAIVQNATEIRLYLERAEPNTEGALARLSQLDRLAAELAGEE